MNTWSSFLIKDHSFPNGGTRGSIPTRLGHGETTRVTGPDNHVRWETTNALTPKKRLEVWEIGWTHLWRGRTSGTGGQAEFVHGGLDHGEEITTTTVAHLTKWLDVLAKKLVIPATVAPRVRAHEFANDLRHEVHEARRESLRARLSVFGDDHFRSRTAVGDEEAVAELELDPSHQLNLELAFLETEDRFDARHLLEERERRRKPIARVHDAGDRDGLGHRAEVTKQTVVVGDHHRRRQDEQSFGSQPFGAPGKLHRGGRAVRDTGEDGLALVHFLDHGGDRFFVFLKRQRQHLAQPAANKDATGVGLEQASRVGAQALQVEREVCAERSDGESLDASDAGTKIGRHVFLIRQQPREVNSGAGRSTYRNCRCRSSASGVN